MGELDDYLQAADRETAVRSNAAAIKHFEQEWKGLLPATSDTVAPYLVACAGVHKMSTLRQCHLEVCCRMQCWGAARRVVVLEQPPRVTSPRAHAFIFGGAQALLTTVTSFISLRGKRLLGGVFSPSRWRIRFTMKSTVKISLPDEGTPLRVEVKRVVTIGFDGYHANK